MRTPVRRWSGAGSSGGGRPRWVRRAAWPRRARWCRRREGCASPRRPGRRSPAAAWAVAEASWPKLGGLPAMISAARSGSTATTSSRTRRSACLSWPQSRHGDDPPPCGQKIPLPLTRRDRNSPQPFPCRRVTVAEPVELGPFHVQVEVVLPGEPDASVHLQARAITRLAASDVQPWPSRPPPTRSGSPAEMPRRHTRSTSACPRRRPACRHSGA